MAGALRTSGSLLLPFTPISRKNPSPICSLSGFDQRNLSKRKNNLRPKILKTLTKPHPNAPIPIDSAPTSPAIPVESPSEQIRTFPSVEVAGEDPKESEIQEFQVSEVPEPEVPEPRIVNHGKGSSLNFLLWLAAAFIVPTIYVWVFGSAYSDSKDGKNGRKNEKDEILEMGVNENSNSKLKLFLNKNGNGGIALVDEAEIERKIEEIQVMAREVRAKEKLEAAKSDLSDDEGDDSFVSNAIGKEVENRLLLLHKPFKKTSKKPPTSSDDYLRRNSERKGAMLFKKKHKFRDISGKPSSRPIGFMGTVKPNGKEQEQSRQRSRARIPVQEKGDVSVGVEMASFEERDKNSGGATLDVANSEHGTDGSNQSMRVEALNKNKPSIAETTVVSNKMNRSKTNLSSKRGKVTFKQSGKKSEKETDFWWLSLPYILVVRVHRGAGGERPQELFSLKSGSGDSHVVAFEDHIDATNFCYILESYFDEFEGFNTEIVVVSLHDHSESVESRMENVIVVRKGQLKLYAGQPLADVEMALHKLIE